MKKQIVHKIVSDENTTIKTKQQKNEWIIIIISAVFLLLSVLYTFTPLNIRFLNIPLSPEYQHDLFVNLFTIQATIAALSISIIAIITGFQTESVYGITVTNYITSLKPILFKHKYLMIVDLLITGINYVIVSFKLYNISVIIFAISILISCILIWDTAFIFKSNSEISKEIGQFIKENLNPNYLNELETSVLEYATLDNAAGVEEALSFINTLFENEINKDKYSSDILEKIESILTNLFIKSYLSTNKNMVLSILGGIDKIYKITNDSKKNYQLNIWSYTYIEYLTFISTVSMFQLRNQNGFDFILYKWNIEKNQVFEKKDGEIQEKNNYYLEYYYTWTYKYIVLKNQDVFEKEDCQYIKKRIFQNAYNDALPYQTRENELVIKRIIGLCYLNKMLIENGELNLLNKEYLRHEAFDLKKADNTLVYIVNIIYSIYLAYQEPMVRGTSEQENAEGYLELIRKRGVSNVIYYLNIVDMLEKHFKTLYKMMMHWEKYEDRVMKTVVLEPAIIDFLFFISIEKYYEEETLAKCFRIISSNNVESILMRYFSGKEQYKERYNNFYKNLYGKEPSENDLSSKQSLVRSALAREYKDELLEFAEKNIIKDDLIERYQEKLNEFIKSRLNEYSIFNTEFNDCTVKSIIIDPGCPINVNEFNDKELGNWLTDYISHYLYYLFSDSFKDNITLRKLNHKLKNKQETLINLSEGLEPDTFIGCRETFWEEEDKNLLVRFTEGMYKISDKYGGNRLYLINSFLVHYSITNIQYQFNDCTADDFEYLDIKVKDNQYYYSRYSSNLKAPFTKDELFEHLRKTWKHLVITADVNYATKQDTVGCGIEISYLDEDETIREENATDTEEQPLD